MSTSTLVKIEPGTLTKEALTSLQTEICDVYRGDNRPWVLGYSGGKDSTAALQLVWESLRRLAPTERHKPLYVISSDTLVETPMISGYIDASLSRMNGAAREQNMPITAHKVSPTTDNTFWVNLIGRGYPVPSNQFRWCTERLKINPANAFILDRVAEHGEVVVVLGVRSAESSTRAQVMTLHRIVGSHLARHSSLPKAFVYTPIETFSVHDVWTYLLQVPSPWGNNNRDLVTMYRNAQAGECPLVVDKTTPSCGNSRFGCWVCTVVSRDSSMEALIENGEEWLEPLLQFRNYLASLQDSAVWPSIRKYKRRNGQVKFKDGSPQPWGPYTLDTRKDLLRRLLEVQRAMTCAASHAQEAQLINKAELEAIRSLWRTEEQDWADSVPQIYREVLKADLDWIRYEVPAFSREEQVALEITCTRYGVPPELVGRLLEMERNMFGMSRRAAIQQRLSTIIEEDWRAPEELEHGGSLLRS